METQFQNIRFFLIAFILLAAGVVPAQTTDLSKAAIIASSKINSPVRETAIRVLQEEVAQRTSINLQLTSKWGKTSIIILATINDNEINGIPVPKRTGDNLPELKKEGYRLFCEKKNGENIIWIIGSDARGILYGIGKLLRTAIMTNKNIYLEEPLDVASSPMQSIRGHQLGYRNTANSYDAWDVKKYDKYIRELILFGTNSIESIPLASKDNSVHMPIPPEEMNIRISEICASYDIDYWAWTPATCDLTDKVLRQAELEKHEAFYKKCPKLDGVFFPGGDPGDNHPRDVLPFLKDLYERLHKYHPEAGTWISLQGFNAEQIDYFYTYLEENNPDWLRGVVSGPGSPSIAETRYRLPQKYKHRHYPDITHNVRCDYPVVNWDQAYMLTIGREGINPMPNYYSKIHATYAPFTDGFISYSDGCHDDVNKVIWSMRGWDIEQDPLDIMVEYCRFFFGPEVAEKAADGIFGLEHNWAGPLKDNGSVETTFAFWQNLEKEANKILATAKEIGAEKAMNQAQEMVNRADTKPISQNLYDKIVQYCDDLFHSIGLQTDVSKYHAANSQRGCILQFVNYPLNNRWWLADEFKKTGEMDSEEKKLERLEVIRTWENPGPGCYYDNVSNIETGPRVLTTSYDACDVAWWDNGYSRARLSSQLFQTEPILEYKNLDFNGKYIIRVSGLGEALIRVDGERLEPTMYNKGIGEFKEFVIPRNLTQNGKIRVTFDRPEESHLRWSKYSHISDVWLIKK